MGDIAVFDVGNVLVRWDPRNLFQKVFADPERMDFFLSEVCSPEWNHAQDAGRMWAEAEAEAIARHPAFAREVRLFRGRWHEMIDGPVEANVRLLEGLRRRGVATFAITNFAADTFAETQERYPFLKAFDGIVCSGLEKICKPDPAIYRLLLDRYRLVAKDCVFIDDSAANIAAAAALGFRTVHYGLGLDAAGAFAQLGLPV
ncbi:MAG TPA: HAD family phosphatase [Beijerinckiaceae bacterium]|nr:HAD family phosphatase [Beijerinckiaceae bacterium]